MPAAVEFDNAVPATTQQLARPAQHPPRITAQPDVAVGEQHGLPAAGAGQRLEHITTKNGRTAASRQPDRGGGLVDTQRREPRARTSSATKRPGPQPKSIVGPLHRAEHCPVEVAVGVLTAQPSAHGQVADLAVVVAHPAPLAVQRPVVEIAQHVRSPPPWSRAQTGCRVHRRPGRFPRRRRCPRRTAPRPASPLSPCLRSASSVAAPVSERDVGMVCRQSAIAGSVTPRTHQPPSRASAEHGVGLQQGLGTFGEQARGHLGRIGGDQQNGTRRPPPPRRPRSRWPVSPRSRRRVARPHAKRPAANGFRCRCWPGPDRPSAPAPGPATGVASTASSVSNSVAAAISAAARSPTVDGQPGLGLTRHRRLGDHHQRHGYHEIARQKSSPAWILPRSDPLTFDLPPVRGP